MSEDKDYECQVRVQLLLTVNAIQETRPTIKEIEMSAREELLGNGELFLREDRIERIDVLSIDEIVWPDFPDNETGEQLLERLDQAIKQRRGESKSVRTRPFP